MIARGAPAWQILLADLALILFIVTASALALGATAAADTAQEAEPHAVMRASPDPSGEAELRRWLAAYRADPREYLTLRVEYPPGRFAAAQVQAARLSALAAELGHTPRLILEQSRVPRLEARFAFDLPPHMARKLQHDPA